MMRYVKSLSIGGILMLMLAAVLPGFGAVHAAEGVEPPNVVLVFVDDMGWGDLGAQGAEGFETPHLDRMAEQGVRFSEFYVSQAVCTASRASLLTGSYANRVSMLGALDHRAHHGLHPDEYTLGDLMKENGYATAVYGKWHLGHLEPFLPHAQGFDEYYGIPYSNDMWPEHPLNPDLYPELPMIEGTEIVNAEVTGDDQQRFTTEFTERAVDFIDRHRDERFFVYLAHPMPHVPLFVSDKFDGVSERGLYGDVIMELDWSVGQILDTLDDLGLDEQTLVMFISDNGPWLTYGDHGGSSGPLREGKGTSFEGGNRVPAIMRWPGVIPQGLVTDQMAMTIDVLPTLAGILGTDLSEKPKIDGRDILPLMTDPEARTPHESLAFYLGRQLESIRSQRFKLHFPRNYRLRPAERATGGQPNPNRRGEIGLELFDLENDRRERHNVIDDHPEAAEFLMRKADEIREELGDSLEGVEGNAVRPPGRF